LHDAYTPSLRLVQQESLILETSAWAALAFRNATDPRAVRALRKGLGEWGFKGLNLGHILFRRLGLLGGEERLPAATTVDNARRTDPGDGTPAPLRVEMELRVWIDDPELGVNNVRSDINLAIWRGFEMHDVTIPFPQGDLHFKHADLISLLPTDKNPEVRSSR
jgi:hypothetical protein